MFTTPSPLVCSLSWFTRPLNNALYQVCLNKPAERWA